jgi:acyl-CoA thioesterase
MHSDRRSPKTRNHVRKDPAGGKSTGDIDIEAIRARANGCPFYRTISMTISEVDDEGSVLRVASDVKHQNLWGTMHGGVIAALVDSSCGLSIAPHLKAGETIVTISLHIDYIAGVTEGNLFGRGKMIHRGSRLARAEAVITSEEGKLIAKGYASFMIASGRPKK